MAFVFYDTETTGTNLYFDQILQFAAILTDDSLVEIDRFEIRSRLQPHIVASPGAMNVTGVTAKQLDDHVYPSHFEMARQIHGKLTEWEPAQFIGHNSIEFDEVLLRSAFYQSLLPVYLTNTNGNSRLDTIKMLRMASVYECAGIQYPEGPKGGPSFKLDQLAPANGFNHANAHEAMSDVEATIFMCRKLRDEAPETWSRFMRFSNKNAVFDFCENEHVFGLTEFYFGRPYTYLLHQIGTNPDDANEIIAFDLSHDPDEFIGSSPDDLEVLLDQRPKPLRRFRSNALPGLIDGDEAHPFSKAAEENFAAIEDRAARLAANTELKSHLIEAYIATKPEYDASPYVEENLYSGFPLNPDKARMVAFQEAGWPERVQLASQFDDERFRELGERIVYMNAPECLSSQRRQFWSLRFANRLLGVEPACKALNLEDAIQQADDLLASAEGEKRTFLEEHRQRLIDQLQEIQMKAA